MTVFCEAGSAPGCDLGVLALGVVLPIVAAAAAVVIAHVWARINYRRAVRARLNNLIAGAMPSPSREPAAGSRMPGRRASSREDRGVN